MNLEKPSSLSQLGHHSTKYSQQEKSIPDDLARTFEGSGLPITQRLSTFTRHVRRQDIARFLTKWEIFKLSLPANGSIVECGVFGGGGLMSWHHFSAISEPYNHTRKVIGFDTFEGFPLLHEKDLETGSSEHLKEGAFKTSDNIINELQSLVDIHDKNRPLGHIAKVELVAGDACQTIPKYVDDNPHLLISLLYLDFDIYKPTKVAIEYLYPRVVKGGIIAFDELNCVEFPGETTALLESLDLRMVKLCRFPYDPYISYFVKE
ncbi:MULTISPECIES: TylF/MycF/NovP-related O-methyltransferase [unclassified Microcystis]|uniref:Class I SAM-dependent methyltransferase n=1 Tax=Microcystis viridis Mv_BB_P_19951000_S68D TaxID=2486270 RepID=A0A552HG89_MICVR|nr:MULTISPECIES: TylF/MycF/NovP-related O-methyltransferase [unclassified Microcystis]MCA2925571.1 class I SAM-dependent methyltransferase [Microcystis sp. M020S1]MCA2933671.1 class I SAM-dependent methyltransferase [Microcystis sp. M015S1]TRU70219.1 MAG: class I SAM-dependent methyltransferase [Microcystis viridis Mv_BB_P_19951000_S68D]TRU71593.1 MAG: class I SAM-dependent methyltransferase [Microcystis viridis Mv_BB_P_19951000_S69]TRU77978.1 MAG: class I SAM-dependent methyltransferase [Micr